MKHYTIMLTAMITFVLLLTGCGEFSIKGEDGEKTTVDLKDAKDGEINLDVEGSDGEKENVSINTDEEGNSSMTIDSGDSTFESNTGKDTELPEGFPKDFPIPDDAELIMSNTITEEGKKSFSVHFNFKQDAEKVYSKIKGYAEDKGMKVNLEQQSESEGHKSYMLNAGSDEADFFQVSIGYLEEKQASVTYGIPAK